MTKGSDRNKQQDAASNPLMDSTDFEWFPVISSPGWLIRRRDKFPNREDEAGQLTRVAWDGFRADLQAGGYGHLLAKRDELKRIIEQSIDNYVALSANLDRIQNQGILANALQEKYAADDPVSVIDKELFSPSADLLPIEDSYTRPLTIEEFCIELMDVDAESDLRGRVNRNWHEREVIAFRLSVLESILDYESLFGPPPSWDTLLKQIKGVPLLGKAEISTQAHETTIAIEKYCRGERKSIQRLSGSTETDNYRRAGFTTLDRFLKIVASKCDPNPKTGRPYSKPQIHTRLEQTKCITTGRGGKTDLNKLGVMIDRCIEYSLVHGE